MPGLENSARPPQKFPLVADGKDLVQPYACIDIPELHVTLQLAI